MSKRVTLATSIGALNIGIEKHLHVTNEHHFIMDEAGCLEDISRKSDIVVLNEFVFRASASHKESEEDRYSALSQYILKTNARVILLAYYRNRKNLFFQEMLSQSRFDIIFVDYYKQEQELVETIVELIKQPRSKEDYQDYIKSIDIDEEIGIHVNEYDESSSEKTNISIYQEEEPTHSLYTPARTESTEKEVNNVSQMTSYQIQPLHKKYNSLLQTKSQDEDDEVKIICWYSIRPGMGTGTIALASAVEIAKGGKRVLLIDADYTHPVIHTISGITHSKRNTLNFFREYEKDPSLDPRLFITTKESILEEINPKQKKMMKNIERLPDTLHYLTFPKDYDFQTASGEWFPNDQKLVLNMLEKVTEGGYEYIFIVVPSLLDDPITLPTLTHANQVINVLTPSLAAIEEYKTMKSYISNQMNGVISLNNWKLILNKTNEIYHEKLENILDETALQVIPQVDLLDEVLDMKPIPEKLYSYIKSIIKKLNWIEEISDGQEKKQKKILK